MLKRVKRVVWLLALVELPVKWIEGWAVATDQP